MKFPKEILLELMICLENEVYEGLTLLENKINGSNRWSKTYEMIFKDNETGKFYRSNYSMGATEYQDERPYQYDGEQIECQEVFAKQVMTTVYSTKKD